MALHWQQRETDLIPKHLFRVNVTGTLPSPKQQDKTKMPTPWTMAVSEETKTPSRAKASSNQCWQFTSEGCQLTQREDAMGLYIVSIIQANTLITAIVVTASTKGINDSPLNFLFPYSLHLLL